MLETLNCKTEHYMELRRLASICARGRGIQIAVEDRNPYHFPDKAKIKRRLKSLSVFELVDYFAVIRRSRELTNVEISWLRETRNVWGPYIDLRWPDLAPEDKRWFTTLGPSPKAFIVIQPPQPAKANSAREGPLIRSAAPRTTRSANRRNLRISQKTKRAVVNEK